MNVHNPATWPCFPLLPMRNNKTGELGFLVAHHNRVYLGNFLDATPNNLSRFNYIDYEYYLEIVEKGWVVD